MPSCEVNRWGAPRNLLRLSLEAEDILNAAKRQNIGPRTYRPREGVDVKIRRA